jgi:hypothetical protein
MKINPPAYAWVILAALLTITGKVVADQFKDIGDAVIHYNAVTTDFFDPNIAKLYGIKRSKNRALLTVTVLKKNMGLAALPVKAKIDATAVNLSNQITHLNLREITDAGAIYYIAEFPVSNKETFDITMRVEPDGGTEQTLSFRQQFYAD